MNNVQKKLKDISVIFIANEENIEERLIDEKVSEVSQLPTFSSLSISEIDEVKAAIKAEFSIKLDRGVLIQEEGHEKWFLARKSQLEMKYWERYKKYLIADKGFSPRVVNTMDDVLDTLTDLLGDPSRNIAYKRRGLIIGDVQSGKTANYTGLICKAVDSGYKVVVLLTGTIEKLRQQTQVRIDEGFVGVDSDAIIKQREDKLFIGAGKYDESVRPVCLTSTADDFKQQNARNMGFDLRNINGPVIFVVKKNCAVLKRLNKWLKTFNQNGDNPINHSLLVIDDEADNASVNTKSEDSPTVINSQIRELLKMFRKSSYVGFTATPFANIFIDPDNYNEMVSEDLFPKDYIYSLDAPSNYIGARNIFSEDGDAFNMLVPIDDDAGNQKSISYILPPYHKSTARVCELPDDLKKAIATFMIANVIEDLRGMKNNHRSMLINISRFTDVQEQVTDLVKEYLKNLQGACRIYGKLEPKQALKDEYIASLKEVYEEVYKEVKFTWREIQTSLYMSCAGIVVLTINQKNGKNLNFDDYKEGLRAIAVGGMSLSRGLTLEGLVISYFYRNSKMYDTLMQMGRWFGYRNGYADLCKIWMSDESIEWYRYISEATDELRAEIRRYEDSDLTPKDFGLRVRSDITSLIVTARNKMKSAEPRVCVISLSGVVLETPEIYSSKEKNASNIESTKQFISELFDAGYRTVDEGRKNTIKPGFKNIPVRFVIDYLEKIYVSPRNVQFDIPAIVRFIKGYKGIELSQWDVAIATGNSVEKYELIDGFEFNCPVRQYSVENDGKILKMSGSKRRLGTTLDGQFGLNDLEIDKIKQGANKKNLPQKAYFEGVKRNPLLTIYFVELGEYVGNKTSENLKVVEDCQNNIFVGFSIGIPSLSNQETKYANYVLNKIALQKIFEGEYDDNEMEDEEIEE